VVIRLLKECYMRQSRARTTAQVVGARLGHHDKNVAVFRPPLAGTLKTYSAAGPIKWIAYQSTGRLLTISVTENL
jgi:hypothetical protein